MLIVPNFVKVIIEYPFGHIDSSKTEASIIKDKTV
jgi:hypothetical protein